MACCKRFQLLIYPDENPKWQLIDREPNHEAKKRAFDVIRKLAEMDFVQQGATMGSESQPPYFGFESYAQDLFFIWLTEHEKDLKESDDHPILNEHLSKYRSLFPSIALILHLIDLADGKKSSHISFDHVIAAIGWCGYLESHARRNLWHGN